MSHSIAIFCGSALGIDPTCAQIASTVGRVLAEQGRTLVYGGGRSGLMGVVADSALAAGGRVIGVIPEVLVHRELAHPDLTELHIVQNMHERKQKMSELADAFIALPGGVGTLEEIFEQWTWAQLGIHQKANAFLNVNGFYDALISFLQHTATQGFTAPRFMDGLLVETDIIVLLEKIDAYQAPIPKWSMLETAQVLAQ